MKQCARFVVPGLALLAWGAGLGMYTGCSSDPDSEAPVVDAGLDRGIILPPDADTPDANVAACDTSKPFGTPRKLFGIAEKDVHSPRLSPDERTMYFAATPKGQVQYDVGYVTRADRNGTFGDPVWPKNINTPDYYEIWPWINGDGTFLYFTSNRTQGNWKMYLSTRPNTQVEFGSPNEVAVPNSSGQIACPFIREGVDIWYAVNSDIYRSVLVNGAFEQGQPVPELNDSSSGEEGPVLTPDGLAIFFTTNRSGAGTQGAEDIWTAERTTPTGTFSSVRPATGLNSSSGDWAGWITPDSCRLYMNSNREGLRTIYVAERPR